MKFLSKLLLSVVMVGVILLGLVLVVDVIEVMLEKYVGVVI